MEKCKCCGTQKYTEADVINITKGLRIYNRISMCLWEV